MRVLTWNVRDLLGDPLAVHRVLRAAEADVVCLQEAPRLAFTRHQMAGLARRSGLLYVVGGRASAGTAILVRLRVEVHEAAAKKLPVATWRTRPRGYATAVVSLPGGRPMRVTSIHLGLTPDERADHVRRIVAASGDHPAVLAGDLNESPGGPSWTALEPVVRDPAPGAGPTFSARHPRRRIDAILASPRLRVSEYGWPDGVDERDVVLASDHRPVTATVEPS